MIHFIEVYSCGHIASQCRCPAVDKVRKTLMEACPECKKLLKKPRPASE